MMDLRRIRVGLEFKGRVNWYEGLKVSASGTKYASAMQNECTVTISGLSTEVRDHILAETNPYGAHLRPHKIIVEAGRVKTGVHRLFFGDVVTCTVSEPPDVTLTIAAKTGAWTSGKVISDSGGPLEPLSAIARRVAAHCEVGLQFEAQDKNIASFTFSGGASQMVDALQKAGNIRAFIDDDMLFVRDVAKPIRGRTRILNMNSGMVGIPRPTVRGVDVTYLIDGDSSVGGALTIESKANKSVNGTYIIEQLGFDVESHGPAFFYNAVCTR